METDIELVNLIKNQVIEEIQKEYYLIRRTNIFDNKDHNKNTMFLLYATDAISEYFKVDKNIVMSGKSSRDYVKVRHFVSLVCRDSDICYPPIPYIQIGNFFGKTHASLMHGKKEIMRIAEVEKKYKDDIDNIKKIIRDSFFDEKKQNENNNKSE